MVIHDDLIMVIYDIYIYIYLIICIYLFIYLFVSVEKYCRKSCCGKSCSLGFYRSRSDRIGMLLDQLFGILQLVGGWASPLKNDGLRQLG